MYSSATDNKTEKLQYANENMNTCSAFEDFDEPYQPLYLYVLASLFLGYQTSIFSNWYSREFNKTGKGSSLT